MTQAAGSKTWATLSAYESTELVKRFVEDRTKEEFDAAKARVIAAHFSQGHEYFWSAASAGALVRPLILYYGAVALARGTVLFLDPDGSGLAPFHGLSAGNWEDLNAKPEVVPQLPVKIQNEGTFPELWRVTGNAEWCMVRNDRMPGAVSAASTGTALSAGVSLTLKEALGQIPDIAELYELTFGKHGRRLRCEVQVTGIPEPSLVDAFSRGEIPPNQEVRRHAWLGIVPTRAGLPSKELVANLLGKRVAARETSPNLLHFAQDPVHRVAESHLFDLYYDAGTEDRPRLDMPVTIDASGEEYLKLPTDCGFTLSTLLALHLIAFAAGTLVRYHPSYWALLTGRTIGDAIAPVVSAAIASVEERYPALILEAIGS